MDTTVKAGPLRLSVYLTGDPARRVRQLSRLKDMNMNQVVRTALNVWGRLEEAAKEPTDMLVVRHADGTETPLRMPA